TGFRIDLPSGSQIIYSYLFQVSTNENYALMTQQVDPTGRTNTFNYDTVGNVVRLRTVIDFDNRTNSVLYDATYTAQIKEVDAPYNSKATFGYDGSGTLTSITNAVSLKASFVYDPQGLITNLVTPYGNTYFRATTNSYGGFSL